MPAPAHHEPMTESILALLGTIGWFVLTVALLVLFGRTEGGGWSIASGVARGIHAWSSARRRSSRPPSSQAPLVPLQLRDGEGHPAGESSPGLARTSQPASGALPARIEELPSRRI
jgi:hypothetical protein